MDNPILKGIIEGVRDNVSTLKIGNSTRLMNLANECYSLMHHFTLDSEATIAVNDLLRIRDQINSTPIDLRDKLFISAQNDSIKNLNIILETVFE